MVYNEPVCRRPCPEEPNEWLSETAQIEYRRVHRLLWETGGLGLLSEVDLACLECYCEAYATLVQMTKDMASVGYVYVTAKGDLKERPEVKIRFQAMEYIRKFAIEFGMSPGARARMSLGVDNGDADPMEEILNPSTRMVTCTTPQ